MRLIAFTFLLSLALMVPVTVIIAPVANWLCRDYRRLIVLSLGCCALYVMDLARGEFAWWRALSLAYWSCFTVAITFQWRTRGPKPKDPPQFHPLSFYRAVYRRLRHR